MVGILTFVLSLSLFPSSFSLSPSLRRISPNASREDRLTENDKSSSSFRRCLGVVIPTPFEDPPGKSIKRGRAGSARTLLPPSLGKRRGCRTAGEIHTQVMSLVHGNSDESGSYLGWTTVLNRAPWGGVVWCGVCYIVRWCFVVHDRSNLSFR